MTMNTIITKTAITVLNVAFKRMKPCRKIRANTFMNVKTVKLH